MIVILFRIIISIMALLTVVCTFRETDVRKQINNAFVLIPMILRILMIK